MTMEDCLVNLQWDIFIQKTLKLLSVITVLYLLSAMGTVNAVSLIVTGSDGQTVNDYRWLIEADKTNHIVPGETCLNGQLDNCLSVKFHQSYMPVVAEG